jgi:hypothetical protein
MNIGGPDIPQPLIPTQEANASDALKEQFKSLADASLDGKVALTVSEVQLTSLFAEKLSSDANPFITEPQVYLRDGQIKIYGKAQKGYLTATVGIIVNASVDADGQVVVEIVSADFGPLPAAQGLNEAISAFIQEAFTGSLGPVAIGFRLEELTIADGSMTISGRIK